MLAESNHNMPEIRIYITTTVDGINPAIPIIRNIPDLECN